MSHAQRLVRCAVSGVLAGVLVSWGIAAAPGAELGSFDGALPVSVSRPLGGSEEPPESARRFLAENGARMAVYWDRVLDTPRLVVPRAGAAPIASRVGDGSLAGDPDGYLVESVLDFIGENRDLFGVDPETLADEEVYAFGEGWLVLLRQHAGGLPIRGTMVRAVVSGEGELLLLKTHLLRDAPQDAPPAANEAAFTEELAAMGLTVSQMEAQWTFAGGDPRRLVPRLRASVHDGNGEPGEVAADLETGEPVAQGTYVYGAGIFDGTVSGIYPTPDEKDPRFFFTKAAEMDIHQVPGVLIRSDVDGQFSDDAGRFELLLDNRADRIQWVLAAGRCRRDREVTVGGRTLSFCPVRSFDLKKLYDFRLIVTSGGGCGSKGFRFEDQDGAIAPEPLETVDVLINELGGEWLSGRLMAFRHVLRFLDHSDGVFRDVNVEPALEGTRALRLYIASPDSNRRHYFASRDVPTICFSYRLESVVLDTGEQAVNQSMTPTLLNHEYAHHVIFKATGFRQSRGFDCRGNKKPHTDCNDLRIEEPSEFVSVVEGVADAVAAFYADLPLFGFLGERDLPLCQAIAYDISAPAASEARMADGVRWTVAHALWGLREALVEAAERGPDPQNAVPAAQRDAERLLYAWLALHRCIGDGCRAFEFGPALVDELVAVDEMFNDGRNAPLIPDILSALGSPPFVRGDADGDGKLMISDAIQILGWLFLGGGELACADALDADDSGAIELTDAIRVLNYLFLGGESPEAPFPGCGIDLSGGDGLPPCTREARDCEPAPIVEPPRAGG